MTELDALKALQWQMTATAFGMVLLAVLVAVMALQIHRLRTTVRALVAMRVTDRRCGAAAPKIVPGSPTIRCVLPAALPHTLHNGGNIPPTEWTSDAQSS